MKRDDAHTLAGQSKGCQDRQGRYAMRAHACTANTYMHTHAHAHISSQSSNSRHSVCGAPNVHACMLFLALPSTDLLPDSAADRHGVIFPLHHINILPLTELKVVGLVHTLRHNHTHSDGGFVPHSIPVLPHQRGRGARGIERVRERGRESARAHNAKIRREQQARCASYGSWLSQQKGNVLQHT